MGIPATQNQTVAAHMFMKIGDLKFASEAPKGAGVVVRKGDGSKDLAALQASINTHGALFPLLVKRFNGDIYVVDGNRRLTALRNIHGKDGAIEVPVVDSDAFSGDPRELALAVDIRLPLHPIDRYEVITELVKGGMSPGDVQLRFDMSERVYAQTMKLGNGLSPMIREKWRTGEIDREAAEVLTVEPDFKEQDRILTKLLKQHPDWQVTRRMLESHVVDSKLRDIGDMVELLGGKNACAAVGIKVDEDLFGTLHKVSDPAKLRKAVSDRVDRKIAELIADGWSWATMAIQADWSYDRIKPAKNTRATAEEAKQLEQLLEDGEPTDAHEELTSAIEARGFTPEQKKKAGCFITVRPGVLSIEYGRVKPADKKAAKAATKPKKAKGPAAAEPAGISNALGERMLRSLTKAVAKVIQRDPKVGKAILIAGAAAQEHAVNVKVGLEHPTNRPADFVSMFTSTLKTAPQNVDAILAGLAAQAISFVDFNGDNPMKRPAVAAICGALNGKAVNDAVRAEFDAEDYFNSSPKAMAVAAVREAMGKDHAAKVGKMVKGAAAKFAIANVGIKSKWLPPELRTAGYDGPGAKKATKK